MKQIIALLCGLVVSAYAQENGGTGSPSATRSESGKVPVASEKLTLQQALEQARIHSPDLRAARLKTLAAEKAVAAAGRWKNPSLLLKTEGFGGDYDGFESAESEIALEQTFERGGKRKYDRTLAEQSIGIVFQAEAEKEMALLAEVRLAFIEVLAQQEVGNVRVEQEQLGRAFVEVAERKHAAGGGSELEVLQAELALEEILLSQTCCFGDLKAARVRLASLIGVAETAMPELVGEYYDLQTLEDTEIADAHPLLKQWNARIEVTRTAAARAGASDAADIKLAAGYKYDAAEDVNSFVAAASIPLNFVRAGRAEQASMLTQADAMMADRQEVRRKLQQELSMLIALYSGAKTEAEMTRDRLQPKAEKAYELSKAGYDLGRYSWFELINAQQNLAEIRVRYIEALRDAHMARSEIYKFIK